MAQFEKHLKSSEITHEDLPEAIKTKIKKFDDLYVSYNKAFEAEDYEVSDKYEADLKSLDEVIVEGIKKFESTLKEEVKELKQKEVTREKEKVAEEPKVENKSEEVKTEKVVSEEVKEEPKAEEDGWGIGMFTN
jgi:hypothetical protein